MALDPWLPIGFTLPDGAKTRAALFEGTDWQIVETQGGGRALVAAEALARRWLDAGLVHEGDIVRFTFGQHDLWSLSASTGQILHPVTEAKAPESKAEALAFAQALKATRAIDAESPLQDALYVEKLSRLLPTYSITLRTGDDVVLGYWLTGGAGVSAGAFRRLQSLSWLPAEQLKDILEAAGVEVKEVVPKTRGRKGARQLTKEKEIGTEAVEEKDGPQSTVFELPGRPELAGFFNEHIVDIVQNRERYAALGIGFPSAVILHGPPGCGKTFAVERLVDFLGWPSFQIDASSVASPYIHETSKKVAAVFEQAMKDAPSVLVIDEMEAFLADREMGSGSSHHRVEEVAEFLRRIPEAVKNEVLIIAMTNRIEMIDAAVQRRGRFDHVIKVDFASEAEVRALLDKLVADLPKEGDVDVAPLAKELAGRPLSDVSFVVREGARLAARSGKDRLSQESLLAALRTAPARGPEGAEKRRIGFV
jgi:ATP-dependent 26S proteasome regulatory subunit